MMGVDGGWLCWVVNFILFTCCTRLCCLSFLPDILQWIHACHVSDILFKNTKRFVCIPLFPSLICFLNPSRYFFCMVESDDMIVLISRRGHHPCCHRGLGAGAGVFTLAKASSF